MDRLTRLPDELLVQCARHLESGTDCCSLALTCHKFASIVQELMFTSPDLRTPDGDPSYVLRFLFLLKSRPDLAKLVRRLSLTINVSSLRLEAERLEAESLRTYLAIATIEDQQKWQNLRDTINWALISQEGHGLSTIIMSLPNLANLEFRHNDEYYWVDPSVPINFGDYFGLLEVESSPEGTQRFHRLVSLTVPRIVSPRVSAFSQLQHLNIGIDMTHLRPQATIDELYKYTLPPTIEKLTVNCRFSILCATTSGGMPFEHQYLLKLVEKTTGLRHARVILHDPSDELDPDWDWESLSYDRVIGCFLSTKDSLETFTLCDNAYELHYPTEVDDYFGRAILLAGFSRLRSLTAPVEFILGYHQDEEAILPNSFDTLRTLHHTRFEKEFQERLLELKLRGNYPHLCRLVLLEPLSWPGTTSRLDMDQFEERRSLYIEQSEERLRLAGVAVVREPPTLDQVRRSCASCC
jgi:hypothetical protein